VHRVWSQTRLRMRVVPGAYSAPLQAYAITQQQNAAGVWGVPRCSFFYPQDWGPATVLAVKMS